MRRLTFVLRGWDAKDWRSAAQGLWEITVPIDHGREIDAFWSETIDQDVRCATYRCFLPWTSRKHDERQDPKGFLRSWNG